MIGGGAGGLACAADLARQGVNVTLLERAENSGGKLRQLQVDGQGIDAGPTVFTMRWVFEGLFGDCGQSLDRVLTLDPIQVLARHAWASGGRLDLFADRQRSAEAIAAFASTAEAKRFIAFCETARAVYAALERPFIRSSRPTLGSLISDLGWRGSTALWRIGPFSNLWNALGRQFRDPRLQQLFGRYATYCGSSPLAAPATLMLVADVEMQGVWGVRGGMVALARALEQLASDCGATLRTRTEVTRILVENGRACGVQLADGETLRADTVVFNGDTQALASGLMGDAVRPAVAPIRANERSLSAMAWCIHARTEGFPLVRHNVFFDDDYPGEFRDIFQHQRLPRRGTAYLCAQDRNDDASAPSGRERMLLLVNAPANGDRHHYLPDENEPCHEHAMQLMRRCGLTIDTRRRAEVLTTPEQFAQLFPGTGGALYGPAGHSWMAAFHRPAAASPLPGLFLAGGSAHPGPGVPMATLSGRLAAATVMAHLDSTSRSRRVVISGGTSTH